MFLTRISTVQEIRARRRLGKIALLNSPKVTVVREGQAQVYGPGQAQGRYMARKNVMAKILKR